jgi:hypothetical protein
MSHCEGTSRNVLSSMMDRRMSHADRGWGSGTLQRLLVEQVYERIKTYVHFKLKTVVRTAAVTIHIDKTL